MADQDRNREEVRLEDVVEVGSRVSWGAIFAGAVLAMAVVFVMTLLGSAIGFSVSDSVDRESLGWGAGIWAILTTMFAMFLGGWITSQCVVGETKTESVVHGIIMWGVALALLLWLTASGIGTGFSALMQMANVAGNVAQNTSQQTWQQMARSAGVSQEQIDSLVNQGAAQARDPQAQAAAAERAQEVATQASWWTLLGTVLSMAAAVLGAILGAGPSFRLLPLHSAHRHVDIRGSAVARGGA